MAATKKRQAQSPLQGEEDDLKRRNIMEDVPVLISLDELSENGDEEASLGENSELATLLEEGSKTKPQTDRPADEKVDGLIDRMDDFMKCFASLHSTVTKNQHSNQRKLKHLETAHNDLISKVVKSAEATENRIETLESKLEASLSANAKLADKIARLEDRDNLQRHVNEENNRKINALDIELGYTNRNMFDCRAEVKERKMIISGVSESQGENTKMTALNCINKVIETAIAMKEPGADLERLRKLKIRELDNVYRIGKYTKSARRRNISVTFQSVDDREMAVKAKGDLKDNQDVKYFFNEDISNDGRILKAELKRIVQVANSQGRTAKMSGNKVTIDSKSYFSNELNQIPPDVTINLKLEKEIEGGIIYKGERSIFSNFYPSPFIYNGVNYLHVEQYFQHSKATHHNDFLAADRILRLSNPRRIKAVGDGIEENETWLKGRMMTLYHGVKAKFDQNWALQDELIATKGKQLYEATTDPYFACGLGYESKRWNDHDWSGENVAGLIVMKVWEELINQNQLPMPQTSNNTLDEIAGDNLETSVSMDTQDKSLENSVVLADVSTSTVIDQASVGSLHKEEPQSSEKLNWSVPCSSEGDSNNISGDAMSRSLAKGANHNGGGRGRGRGRGGRGHGRGRGQNTQHNQSQNQQNRSRKPPNKMTSSDRSFLCGNDRNGEDNQKSSRSHKSNMKQDNSSTKPMDLIKSLGLNDSQLKGLAKLGLNLNMNQSDKISEKV